MDQILQVEHQGVLTSYLCDSDENFLLTNLKDVAICNSLLTAHLFMPQFGKCRYESGDVPLTDAVCFYKAIILYCICLKKGLILDIPRSEGIQIYILSLLSGTKNFLLSFQNRKEKF